MSCKNMNCTSLCCNSRGTCPESYSKSYSSSFRTCSVYYKDLQANSDIGIGVYVGIGAAGLLLIIIIISIICYCYRRKKALKFLEQNKSLQSN